MTVSKKRKSSGGDISGVLAGEPIDRPEAALVAAVIAMAYRDYVTGACGCVRQNNEFRPNTNLNRCEFATAKEFVENGEAGRLVETYGLRDCDGLIRRYHEETSVMGPDGFTDKYNHRSANYRRKRSMQSTPAS